ncbi:chitinase-3-like protein 1 isoform X3 [Danio rerio]
MNRGITHLIGLNLLFQFVACSKLVCYFTNWSQYRSGTARYLPENVDPNLCTHLIYAFAIINYANNIAGSEWNDVVHYSTFNALKKRNPQLITLLSVRDQDSSQFSIMLSKWINRQTFIKSSIEFLRKYNFDGLDLDWEMKNTSEMHPEDKLKFTLLCKELLEAFVAESLNSDTRLILTATVSAQKDVIERSYIIPEISEYLDFINVKTFDFHTYKDGIARHHSALYSAMSDDKDIKSNTDFALQYWRSQGAPAEKLLMGFSTYGRSFILNSSQNGVGAPANKFASPGPHTQEIGLWAYYEICLFLNGGVVQWIEDQKVPFSVKGNDWVGFDSLRSFNIKTKYLLEHGFGGAFVWALDLDDFSGYFCGQGTYPLVNSLKKSLIHGIESSSSMTSTNFFFSIFATAGKGSLPTPICVKIVRSFSAQQSLFCANRSDGLYYRTNSLNSFYSCSEGITNITWCTPFHAISNNSRKVQLSLMIIFITLGSAGFLTKMLI